MKTQKTETTYENLVINPAKPKTKFYFIRIEERNGEREYTYKIVREISTRVKDVEKWIDKNELRSWYDGKPEKVISEEGYYFLGGAVHVQIDSYKEISETDFNTLKNYL